MKNLVYNLRFLFVLLLLGLSINLSAQKIQNYRAYDQTGINQFEAPKDVNSEFTGRTIKVGGAFTQQFQSLSHSNDTTFSGSGADLYHMAPGFNLATANLNIDAQLADGIRLSLENYMSSRHHVEFWVKGGYVQIDKLPMFNSPEWFTKYLRVKIGHFQPNFGDQMLRRSDNGNAMYNAFVGNYIMDAFTTEIGSEVYLFPAPGLMAMAGMTTGLIKDDIKVYENGKQRQPSIYLKGAYSKTVNDDASFRLSASFMMNQNSGRNTLYGGDRTGGRFNAVMELAGADLGSKAWPGRWNPRFTNKIMAFQVNPFIKVKGLEFFGTFERATGNNLVKSESGEYEFLDNNQRSVNQLGGELIYRFYNNESLYIGGRFNQLSGELSAGYKESNGDFLNSKISRIELVAGWFVTENLLMKAEYVNQNYVDFPTTDYRYDGNFNGFVIEAVAAF